MPRPRPLTPQQAKRSLANRFGGTKQRPGLADRLRQLATKFGIRPTRVFMVWTTWTGETQGEGTQHILHEVEILPTPKIVDSASSILRDPRSAGFLPTGSIIVTDVSVTWTQDELEGRVLPGGQPIDTRKCDFFYELREDGRGDNPPTRERFILAATPSREAGFVRWNLYLSRSSEDRSRAGQSQYGVDRG